MTHRIRRRLAPLVPLAMGAALSFACRAGLSGSSGDLDGSDGGESAPGEESACGVPPRRIWKLTPAQIERTEKRLLGIEAKTSAALATTITMPRPGFSNDASVLTMSEPHVVALLDTARDLAGEFVASRPPDCMVTAPSTACTSEFLSSFLPRAYRGDVVGEREALAAFHAAELQASTPVESFEALIAAILMSPNFLFRTELGAGTPAADGTVLLTRQEQASALSYFLTDEPPDELLMGAAAQGNLETSAGLETEVERMLGGSAEAHGFLTFLLESFEASEASLLTKDTGVYPAWSSAVAAEAQREASMFLMHHLKRGGSVYDLLTSTLGFPGPRLAEIYGVAEQDGVDLGSGRPGILTRTAVLASLARQNDTAPVLRGLFIRDVVLCDKPEPPPGDLNFVAPPPDGERTQRERLAAHVATPSCKGCHAEMDPIGLPFEVFDGIGVSRTADAGKPIDTTGSWLKQDGTVEEYPSAVELIHAVANSEDALSCFSRRAAAYSLGRTINTGVCPLDQATLERVVSTSGSLREVALALVSHPRFFRRSTRL